MRTNITESLSTAAREIIVVISVTNRSVVILVGSVTVEICGHAFCSYVVYSHIVQAMFDADIGIGPAKPLVNTSQQAAS